jgi:uncharacterized membrane protein
MTVLAIGLALFLGIHLLPILVPLRTRLYAAWGEARYKITFSVVSALGLALIVYGWWIAPHGPQLFAPSPAAMRLAPYAVTLAFILLASSHGPSHLRAAVKHPMLIGVIVWALVHLLANGDARGTLLFGAFLAYGIVDLVSAIARGAVKTFEPQWRADVIAVVVGIVIALAVMTFHRVFFGLAVVAFSI